MDGTNSNILQRYWWLYVLENSLKRAVSFVQLTSLTASQISLTARLSVVHIVNVTADVFQVVHIPFINVSAHLALKEIISGRSFIQNWGKYIEDLAPEGIFNVKLQHFITWVLLTLQSPPLLSRYRTCKLKKLMSNFTQMISNFNLWVRSKANVVSLKVSLIIELRAISYNG